jgi:SAM-dependent methyltransferase
LVPVCSRSYWDEFAESFAALGPPLRPSSEDIGSFEEAVANWAARYPHDWLRALLLGVTPELARMRWPERSTLLAVDNSMAMAQAVWPGNVAKKRWAVCGDWLALPRPESSCQVVVGDGSINCLRYPDGFQALAKKVREVLSDNGILALRCYAQPAVKEHPEEVFAGIFDATIPSFHHFKFRLLMAMQPSTEQGIAVNDVYKKWASHKIDEDMLIARSSWERRAIRTIEYYRDKETVHTFPTLEELRSVLLDFFDEVSCSSPSYPLGERCPLLVLKPKSSRSRNLRPGGEVC